MGALQDFLARGGPILTYFIIPATFIMLALILERLFYFRLAHGAVAKDAISEWRSRSDSISRDANLSPSQKKTFASWTRDKLISEVRGKAEQNIIFAKLMVALAPLLGLLGTVTGMVEVFDVLAITSGTDPRAMSSGVSRATIPTMAGMVASIVGVIFTSGMTRKANRLVQLTADEMEMN